MGLLWWLPFLYCVYIRSYKNILRRGLCWGLSKNKRKIWKNSENRKELSEGNRSKRLKKKEEAENEEKNNQCFIIMCINYHHAVGAAEVQDKIRRKLVRQKQRRKKRRQQSLVLYQENSPFHRNRLPLK